MGRSRGATSAAIIAAMLLIVLVPVNESEASEPTVVFSTDFEGIGIFISDWAPLGWSRGDYAPGHEDDLWCRANQQVLAELSDAVGYTISAHSSVSALYGAKMGTNHNNEARNIDNGYPDPGMDSWVRYAPPNAASYDGMTLTFWYWAKTESASYQGELNDLLLVNINDGTSIKTVWRQPSPDSQGWRMATIDLPAGTVWMEWEFKTSETPSGHYPGVLIDDMTVTAGKVLPGPPTSHVSGMSAYYGSRNVQVPVGVSDADRISLYYRQGAGDWTMYVDPSHPTGLFEYFTIPFQAPGDGRFEVFSIASNDTYTEPLKTAAEASFYVDTAAPTVRITAPTPSSMFGRGTVTVEWTSGDTGSGVALTAVMIDDRGFTNATGTSYTFSSLSEGKHTATVLVNDRAGNTARASVTFTVDLTAPTMTFSPTGAGVDRTSPITVSFQDKVDKASIGITVEGVTGSLSWDGDTAKFIPSSTLAPSTTYSVIVTGRDAAGDAFNESWSFTTAEDRGSITGTVRDGSGNAVAFATVRLSNGMSTVTDENGHFELANVTSGSYTLNVGKEGYGAITSNVVVTALHSDELGTLSLGKSTGSVPLTYYAVAAMALIVLAGLGVVNYLSRRKR